MTEVNRLLRLPDVMKMTGWKRSSIYAAVNRGDFPKPIKLGARAIAWTDASLSGWIQSRLDAGHAPKSTPSNTAGE